MISQKIDCFTNLRMLLNTTLIAMPLHEQRRVKVDAVTRPYQMVKKLSF